MTKRKPTFDNVIGFFVEPVARPTWTGEIVNLKTGELVKEPSMTKQSFKEECDINFIVKKFEATGNFDHVANAMKNGYFADLPSGLDLQEGYNRIAQAEAAFMALPAAVRAEFDNDPVAFVEAFNNPSAEQQERFIALGLGTDTRPPSNPDSNLGGATAKPSSTAPATAPSSDGSKTGS